MLFIVKLYKYGENVVAGEPEEWEDKELILFCRTPRTRKEICEYLGLSSVSYAIQTHVMPLVEKGIIKMSIPEKPNCLVKAPGAVYNCTDDLRVKNTGGRHGKRRYYCM